MQKLTASTAAALLASAVWLASCGNATVATTAPPSPTPTNATASVTPTPAAPTSTPAPPTPSASPTPTLPPTPEAIVVENADRFQPVRVINIGTNEMSIFARALSEDDLLLAVSGSLVDPATGHQTFNTFLRLIDLDSGRTLFDLDLLAPVVRTMAFSPDGSMLAVAACQAIVPWSGPPLSCDPSSTRLWTVNVTSGEIAHDLGRFSSPVARIVWSPDSSRLYTGVLYSLRSSYSDNEVAIFDAATGQRLGIVQPQVSSGYHVLPGISTDGRFVIVHLRHSEGDPALSSIQWWDASDPVRPRRIHLEHPANGFLLSPDGATILTITAAGSIMRLIDLESGQVRHTITGLRQLSNIKDLAFAGPDQLVWLQPEGEIQLYDLAAQALLSVPDTLPRSALSLHLAPDGHTALVVPANSSLSNDALTTQALLWDIRSSQVVEVPAYVLHGLRWTRLSFDSEQTRLISLDLGIGQVVVWGIRLPEQQRALAVLRDYLNLLAAREYESAAGLLELVEDAEITWQLHTYDLATIAAWVPEADPADAAGLLEILCSDERFPCAPVLEVVYQAQVDAESYMFLVTFAGEDGRPAEWPPCRDDPISINCYHRDGAFVFAVRRQPDDTFRVVNGMPPAFELRAPD